MEVQVSEHGRYIYFEIKRCFNGMLIVDQMLPGTNHARAIARSGVDWVCVDCEHGNIDGMTPHTSYVD